MQKNKIYDYSTKHIKKIQQSSCIAGYFVLVDKSDIFGLIGLDGAGKTTQFRILKTLILADGDTHKN